MFSVEKHLATSLALIDNKSNVTIHLDDTSGILLVGLVTIQQTSLTMRFSIDRTCLVAC